MAWTKTANLLGPPGAPPANVVTTDTSQVISGLKTVNQSVFQSSAVGTTALTVQAVAGQTADLQRWYDASNGLKARVDSSGILRVGSLAVGNGNGSTTAGGSLGVVAGNATTPAFVARGVGSQTANLTEWQISGGSVVALVASGGSIRTSGVISAGTTSGIGGQLGVLTGAAATVGAIVRGAASQTADLTQWQDNAGTVIARVASNGDVYDSAGRVYSPGNPPPTTTPSNMVTTDTTQSITGTKSFRQVNLEGTGGNSAGFMLRQLNINTGAYGGLPTQEFEVFNDTAGTFGVWDNTRELQVLRIDRDAREMGLWVKASGVTLAGTTVADGTLYENGNRVYSAANPPPGDSHGHISAVTDGAALPSAHPMGMSTLTLAEGRDGTPNWPGGTMAATVVTWRGTHAAYQQQVAGGYMRFRQKDVTGDAWDSWYDLLDDYALSNLAKTDAPNTFASGVIQTFAGSLNLTGSMTANTVVATSALPSRESATVSFSTTYWNGSTSVTEPIVTRAKRTSSGAGGAYLDVAGPLRATQLSSSTTGREVTSFTTASLAVGASATQLFNMGATWRLLRVATSVPARVRMYVTEERATADAARAMTTTPSGNHGLNAEIATATGTLDVLVAPTIVGFQMAADGAAASTMNNAVVVVNNLHTAASAVTVTFTWQRLETAA